jgi:hypothetical protein
VEPGALKLRREVAVAMRCGPIVAWSRPTVPSGGPEGVNAESDLALLGADDLEVGVIAFGDRLRAISIR